MREVFAEHRPTGRLPRRRLQARRPHGGQPGRGRAQQRARHAPRRARSPASRASRRFVLVSTDKAVAPATVMGASKALAEWAVEAAAARHPGTRYVERALRQRARLVGLGRADLPPPDRRGRPGDGHRPADDALLHDDPRGGAARSSGRARWASGGEVFVLEMGDPVSILELARDMIRAVGPGARAATSRSRSSGAGRARSSTRSCSTPTSARSPRRPRRSCVAERDPLDPALGRGGLRPRSGCSSSRATRPGWRRRWPSCRPRARRRRASGPPA